MLCCKRYFVLATVISIVETFDLRPSSLVTSSVPRSIFLTSTSFTNDRRSNSIVSTALLMARPLALTVTSFPPALKKVRQATT